MDRATSSSMQGSNESKKAAKSSDHKMAGEGATGQDNKDGAKEKQHGCSASREGKRAESNHKNSSQSSRAEARAGNLMMQRWLDETPNEEPFSSVGYHAKRDKNRQ